MSNPNAGTELATTEAQARGVPITLNGGRQNDFDATYRLAKNLAISGIIPRDLQGKAADVMVIVLYGQELGLAPMQALQVIDVVKGRPSLRANLWVALARKAGHKVRVVENTATSTTVTVVRHDDPEPISATYTIDDAKLAGLTSNDNYRKNPKAMLYARAASTAIRQACPEVAMGFYDEYEVGVGDQPAPARPTLAKVAAEREDRGGASADGTPSSPSAQPGPSVEPVPVAPDPAPTADEYAAIEAEYAETVDPALDFVGGES